MWVVMFIPLKDNMPKATFPMMTFILIALNVAIYFMASSNPIAAQNTAILYGVIPYELTNSGTQCVPTPDMVRMICGTTAEIQAIYPNLDMPPTWMTVATSMFLHGGLMHLIGNMLFLFVFGGALENALGKLSFSLFYLVGGVAAVLGQTLWDTGSAVPMVGASGAIASVLAGYMVLFPSAKILSLFIIFPMRVRAFWVIGSWIFFQFVDAYLAAGAGSSGGVAVWAHIGGFVAGAALTYLIVNHDQIEEYRRNARVASGLMVDPLVPYEPNVTHYSQRYVPQQAAAAYAAPPGYAYPPPPPPPPPPGFAAQASGAPGFVTHTAAQNNLWVQPQAAQPMQSAYPPPAPPTQQRYIPPDPFAVPQQATVPPDPFAPPPQATAPMPQAQRPPAA